VALPPGIRVFASPRFRTVLAACLLLVGVTAVVMLLVRQATAPGGQFGFDFAAYHEAARNLAGGRSPYAASMLAAPIPAQGEVLYKYAPPFAQLLMPLAVLPVQAAAVVWLAIQAVLGYAAVWFAGSLGGARRSLEQASVAPVSRPRSCSRRRPWCSCLQPSRAGEPSSAAQ